MSWSSNFLDALSRPRVSLRWAVESFFCADGSGLGRPAIYSSHPIGVGRPWLAEGGVTVGAHSVSLAGWSYRRQSWSFRLAAPRDIAAVAESLRPGTLVRVRCDALGLPYGTGWEIIQSGIIATIRWEGGDIEVQVNDLLTGLRNRFATLAANLDLYPNAGTETTLTSSYTPGDGTLQVTSTAGFDELSGALTDMVLVTPNTGDPFYLTYTGTGAGPNLAGVSTLGQRGTTAVAAVSGDTVQQQMHQVCRPDQFLARTLASTGSAFNGVYDVLPQTWGYALDWSSTIDTNDMVNRWGNGVFGAVTGGWDLDIITDTPQSDGLAWVLSVLSSVACWPVNYQGKISLRTPQDPRKPTVGPDVTIRDTDIRRDTAPSCEWYHPDRRTDYSRSTAISASGSTSNSGAVGLPIGSYPAAKDREYNASGLVFSNESNVRANLAGRTAPWDSVVPERVNLPLTGLRWAALAPGDLVLLDLPEAAGRHNLRGRLVSTSDGYRRRVGMVDEVRPDWQGGGTDISVAVVPTSRADDRR